MGGMQDSCQKKKHTSTRRLGRKLVSRASLSLARSFELRTTPWQMRLHPFLVQDDLREIKGAAPTAHDVGRTAQPRLLAPSSSLVELAAGLDTHARAQQQQAHTDTS